MSQNKPLNHLSCDRPKLKNISKHVLTKHAFNHVNQYITKRGENGSKKASVIVSNLVKHLNQHDDGKPGQSLDHLQFLTIAQLLDFNQHVSQEHTRHGVERKKSLNSVENSPELFSNSETGDENVFDSNEWDRCDILIGTLTNDGSIRKHLYLSDSTGRKLCHMLLPDTIYLDSVILLEKWKYVSAAPPCFAPFSGYIEVLSKPVILHPGGVQPTNVSSASVTSGTRISGTVTHVSSCLKHKNWHYVISIMTDGRLEPKSILLSDRTCPYWSSCVLAGSKVTTTSLKRSKITVNGMSAHVYVPTDESVFTVGTAAILSDFLTKEKIIKQLQVLSRSCEKVLVGTDGCSESSNSGSISYVGEISRIISPELGLFSLDSGRAILHCTYLLFEDFGCAFRPGAIIIVSCAHFFGQNGCLHLVCCAHSEVRVVLHSKTCDTWKPICVAINTIPWSLAKSAFLRHPVFTASLPDAAENISRNFPFLKKGSLLIHKVRRSEEFASDCIIVRLAKKRDVNRQSDVTGTKIAVHRDRYAEVLHSPHACIVQAMLKEPATPMRLVSVKELMSLATMKAEERSKTNNGPRYWNHILLEDSDVTPTGCQSSSWSDTLVMLGCIRSSKRDSSLQLFDNTAAINCIILRPNGSPKNGLVVCTKDLHTLVRVLSFQVIVETSSCQEKETVVADSKNLLSEALASEGNETDSHTNCKLKIYIIFSTEDAEILKQPGQKSCSVRLGCGVDDTDTGAKSRLGETNAKSHSHTAESQLSNDRRSKKAARKSLKSSLDDNSDGVVRKNPIRPPNHPGTSVKSSKNKLLELIVFVADVQPVRHPKLMQVPFFFMTGTLIDRDAHSEQNLVFKFIATSVKWRPFLKPGSLVEIRIPAELYNSTTTVQIDDSCTVHHVHGSLSRHLQDAVKTAETHWNKTFHGKSVAQVISVSQAILNSTFQSQTMSIRGKIIDRYAFFELNELKTRLEVSDTTGVERLCIYTWNDQQLCDGLIPGATVVFRKLNICVSWIGNVYGKLQPTTEIIIESFTYTTQKNTYTTQKNTECLDKKQTLPCVGAEVSIANKKVASSSRSTHNAVKSTEKFMVSGTSSQAKDVSDQQHCGAQGSSVPHLVESDSGSKNAFAEGSRLQEQIKRVPIIALYQQLFAEAANVSPQVVMLDVCPKRVLQVCIPLRPDSSHDNGRPDGTSFYAKCIAKDHSGRVILHFGHMARDSFFRFAGLDAADITTFNDMCRVCDSECLLYDIQQFPGTDAEMFSKHSERKRADSLAQSTLDLICVKVNGAILPKCTVVARPRGQNVSPDAMVMGNFENSLPSYNLKLLQFDCIKVE